MATTGNHHSSAWRKPLGGSFLALSSAALGVVYGDIGTSPLYAMHEIFAGAGRVPLTPVNIVGATSTILWALILVVCLKYVVLIMRADNHGEGGIMALLALAVGAEAGAPRKAAFLLLMGAFGAALFYGDGVITPAISVLSAVEGAKLVDASFAPFVVPISACVLVGLFVLQRRGTARVGRLFGPVMLVWFLVLALGGAVNIAREPAVLAALNPAHAFRFLLARGTGAFAALGAVVLAFTGAEALYADMGHFGRAPIRLTWFLVVFPCLGLNYLGQAALLLAAPDSAANPFYLLYPRAALYPMIVLAAIATVIASQAVISGAFSMTQQAIQIGLLPRMKVLHTSAAAVGQVYVPIVNWLLFAAVLLAVLGFRTSSNLASAYGIAVTGTMIITTALTFFVIRDAWKYGKALSVAATIFFLCLDGTFFSANLLKIASGGWLPIIIAVGLFALMSTWHRGRALLLAQLRSTQTPLPQYLSELPNDLCRAPGTAVYLVANPEGAPRAFINNLQHNRVLHETIIFLSVSYTKQPHVAARDRSKVETIRQGVYKASLAFGFMERPDLPLALDNAREEGLLRMPAPVSYFVSREDVVDDEHGAMSRWRLALFAATTRLSRGALDYLGVPPQRVVELGTLVRL